MRNFVCPQCGEIILKEYNPVKAWFVFGSKDNCNTHESIDEFNTQEKALLSLNSVAAYNVRFASDDLQKDK